MSSKRPSQNSARPAATSPRKARRSTSIADTVPMLLNTMTREAASKAAANSKARRSDTAQAKGKPRKAKAKTREGKKGLVVYLQPEMNSALRALSHSTGQSVQALAFGALNKLLAEHGLAQFPSAAPDQRR